MLLINRGTDVPFYTVIIDFIPILPVTPKEYNNLLIITYKFSKRVLLLLGRII